MLKTENPDIMRPVDVPGSLRPYVRRALVTDSEQHVNMNVDVRATGYHYLSWVWRGRWQGCVNGEVLFDSDQDGPLLLTGQVRNSIVVAKMQRDVGQVFLEFTAIGHFQLLGITGKQMLENAVAPQILNPALKAVLDKVRCTDNMTVDARMGLLGSLLGQLPKHTVPKGIVAAIDRMEAADGDIRIADLTRELGLAERQFRSNFEAAVGLTPKVFCKTIQINGAFNQLLMNHGGDLAGIAAQAGFADQAHFTRNFTNFLGKAPKSYLKDVEATLLRFVGNSRSPSTQSRRNGGPRRIKPVG